MRNDTKQKTRKEMYRRILAGFCAVAIALLQCAVLLTIETEPAHAADGVTIVVTYAKGTEATKNVSVGALRGYSATKKTLDGEAEGETVEVSGPTVGQILKSNKVTNYGSISPFNENDIIVVKKGGKNCDPVLWTEGVTNVAELSDVDGAGIETSTTIDPIKFKSGPSYTPQSPKEGDTIKISYSLDIDAFYKSSNEYDEGSDTEISWSTSGAGKINLSDTITSGTGAQSLSGTITKAGSITITPNSLKFDAASGKITVTGSSTTKPTTAKPTTKPPTTAKPTTQKGTTKKGGSDDDDDDKDLDKASIVADQSKLKKKTYKNSELKKLIKVRLNGEYVKKKYWKVVYNKYDKTSDKLIIEIEGQNGYTGGTRQAVYFSSTTTTRRYTGFTTRNYTPYRASSRSTLSTNTTGTTVPNVTYSPDRTITVKEVFLGQQVVDEPETTPYEQWNDAMDDYTDENWDEEEMEDQLSLDFGPAAGSAAVAAAACGAGVVGRIRRFHSDMADPIIETTKNSLDTGDVAPSEKTEKKIKLPKKFFKK